MGVDVKGERERTWRGHLAAWGQSVLSQAAYCLQHGLKQSDFSWWKREIARRGSRVAAAAPAFVPVQIAVAATSSYAFELSLCGGRVLRFGARVDPAALTAVVRALEAAVPQPGDGSC
jgi:hypothetical protein